jgi:hypothetical protein
VLWLVIEFAAAIDLGLGFNEIVIRPLVAQPIDPRVVSRVVMLAVLAFAGMRLVQRPRSPQHARSVVGAPSTRAVADRGGEALAACLHSIRRSLTRQPTDAVPLAVHVGGRIAEIFWDRSPPPVFPPWRATPSGWVWEAARDQLDVPRHEPDVALLPALVTVGSTPTGLLWLNLEAFRVVSLTGAPSGVERLARHLLGQLRRSASTGTLDLELRPATSDAREALLDVHRPRRAADSGGDGSSALSNRARRRERGGARPLVVVIAPGRSAPATPEVFDPTRIDASCTYIVLGPVPNAELCLRCQDDEVRVPFLGDVHVTLDATDRRASDAVAPAVSQLTNREPAPVPDRDDARSIPVLAHDAARTSDAAVEVEVRVLGPVDVRGSAGRLAGKSLELVAYLALHPDGAHEDQIRTALWPDRPLSPNSWATRVSITRRALGHGSDGSPRLARLRDHVGRLTRDVRVDLDMLAEALAHPDDAGGLHAALTLVRGRPFDAARGFEWAQHESHVTRAERLVVDAAHQLSTLASAVGDWSQARWAVDRGLSACPDSELLYQDRRRAVAAGGGGEPHASPGDTRNDLETETQRRDTIALDELLHRREPSDPK